MKRCTEIRLGAVDKTLRVTFGDGQSFGLPHELLRVFSPSAEVRAHDGTWDLPPRRRGVAVKSAEPVGNYAVRLVFDDGHDSGLFSYELLHDLGSQKMRRMREYLRELKRQGKTRHRTLRKRT
jgi:DUF971 family protein